MYEMEDINTLYTLYLMYCYTMYVECYAFYIIHIFIYIFTYIFHFAHTVEKFLDMKFSYNILITDNSIKKLLQAKKYKSFKA